MSGETVEQNNESTDVTESTEVNDLKKVKTELEDVPPEKLEELRSEIVPLSHQQCVDILLKASAEHNDVLEHVKVIANQSPTHRRLMVRNVAFVSTTQGLLSVFEPFGEIEEGAVVLDRSTGQSRGFGFVTFKNMESARQVMASQVILDGRQLLVKLAADPQMGGHSNEGGSANNLSKRKLFLRNLSDTMTSEMLRTEMGKFGAMDECMVITDNQGKSKGFAFVTYTDVDSANSAMAEPQRIMDGRMVFITLAEKGRKEHPPPGSAADRSVGGHAAAGGGASFGGSSYYGMPPAQRFQNFPPQQLNNGPAGQMVQAPMGAGPGFQQNFQENEAIGASGAYAYGAMQPQLPQGAAGSQTQQIGNAQGYNAGNQFGPPTLTGMGPHMGSQQNRPRSMDVPVGMPAGGGQGGQSSPKSFSQQPVNTAAMTAPHAQPYQHPPSGFPQQGSGGGGGPPPSHSQPPQQSTAPLVPQHNVYPSATGPVAPAPGRLL
eukprot:Filipodium_phascolosomae@DN40_c0_g1_i2.p1